MPSMPPAKNQNATTGTEQPPKDVASPKRAKPAPEKPHSPPHQAPPQWPTDDMTDADLSTLSEVIQSEMETIDQKIKLLEHYIAQQEKFRAPSLSSTQRAFQRGPTCCGGIHAE